MVSMPAHLSTNTTMKKITTTVLGASLLAACLLTLGSCGEKKKAENPLTGFEQAMTDADSTEVIHLVDVFFSYAEHGDYDAAAAMLFQNNVDSVYNEPQPLDNNGMAEVKRLLSSLPIQSHRIDYVKFKETYANEVKCTAVIMPAHDNVPEIKSVFYFKPVNHLGTWKLCLVDSHHGDHTVVAHDKKDSMQNEFQTEMREKNLSKMKK